MFYRERYSQTIVVSLLIVIEIVTTINVGLPASFGLANLLRGTRVNTR
jgi:hypothetical protein